MEKENKKLKRVKINPCLGMMNGGWGFCTDCHYFDRRNDDDDYGYCQKTGRRYYYGHACEIDGWEGIH